MPKATHVRVRAGCVYRTEDFRRWSANPARLVKRLVREGKLVRLAHGLFVAPSPTKFGAAPPTADRVLRALLKGGKYVFTGPERWNALGLGATSVTPVQLVYNRKRTGDFELGGHRLRLRRVAFPAIPSAEWYVVDLLENLGPAGVDGGTVERRLAAALARGRFRRRLLVELAGRYGTQRTQDRVRRALLREPRPRTANRPRSKP